jgi:hypothetical protein
MIPSSLESRLPAEGNKFCQAVADIDFKRSQEMLIVIIICICHIDF